jgi:hypothetical protein
MKLEISLIDAVSRVILELDWAGKGLSATFKLILQKV